MKFNVNGLEPATTCERWKIVQFFVTSGLTVLVLTNIYIFFRGPKLFINFTKYIFNLFFRAPSCHAETLFLIDWSKIENKELINEKVIRFASHSFQIVTKKKFNRNVIICLINSFTFQFQIHCCWTLVVLSNDNDHIREYRRQCTTLNTTAR